MVGYEQQQVDRGFVPINPTLGKREVETLYRVRAGLVANGETLMDGFPVGDATSVIRWLLQQIADNE